MARLLQQVIERPRACSYLPGAVASLENRLMVDVEGHELEALFERGWRRFGPVYFRPACAPCGECVSLRLPVADWAPTRSQRRAARKCATLRCEIGPVRVDDERLALYARWHANRELMRRWEPSPLDRENYVTTFAFPHPCAREVAYYDDGRLVALGLCDETPRAWSAAYFFYDPAYTDRSPGTYHLVNLVSIAARDGKAHVYLGYRINDCPSMRYKASFHPHELLSGRPGPHEAPRWERRDRLPIPPAVRESA